MLLRLAFSVVVVTVLLAQANGHKHHQDFEESELFSELSDEQRQEFRDVWRDKELSRKDQKAKIQELAEKTLTAEQLVQFNQLVEETKAKWEKRREEMTASLEKLSPEAREVAEKIGALYRDETLSWSQMKKQKKELMNAATEEVQDELREWKRQFKHHGGGHRRHHHKEPAFLAKLTDEQRQQFRDLWRNKELSRNEKDAQLRALAEQTLTPAQLEQYDKTVEDKKEKWQKKGEEMKASLEKLSAEAKAVAEEIGALYRDDNLSWSQLKEQKKKLMDEAPEAVQKELREWKRQFKHGRRHGGDDSSSREGGRKSGEKESKTPVRAKRHTH